MMLASILVMALIIFIANMIGFYLGFYIVGPLIDEWKRR